jgi:hypothetical protein
MVKLRKEEKELDRRQSARKRKKSMRKTKIKGERKEEGIELQKRDRQERRN